MVRILLMAMSAFGPASFPPPPAAPIQARSIAGTVTGPSRLAITAGEERADGIVRSGLVRAAIESAAEGLFYQLPPDGSWVELDATYTYRGAAQELSGRQTFWMGSVGTVTENGEEHRWIEFKIVEGERFWIRKLLIPVRYLRRGEDPTLHVVRGWTLQENRAVEPAVAVHGRWPAYLAGPLRDEKPLPPAVVTTSLGALEAEGIAGWIEFTEEPLHTKVTFETRLHPKAPFGVLSSRMLFECTGQGEPYTIDARAVLARAGHGAKTALPDHR